MLKVGNGQGFWGDRPLAPYELMAQQPDLDFLTLDYLAEVSLGIMAAQREKDPHKGYAADFVECLRTLIPLWKAGSVCRVVTNAGGLNPEGCRSACQMVLAEAGYHKKIALVTGDDVLAQLQADPKNPLFANLESGEPLTHIADKLVAANAYLGAQPIAEAIARGAELIITGRVCDPSLTVGPCLAHYGWQASEWDRLAGATIAGHLIECGAQVTGGLSNNWLDCEDPWNLGYPIAEIDSEGNCLLTKPYGTGGYVTVETVKEQLLYEIGDPDNYLSPDVAASFLSLRVEESGLNRILIKGARGKKPPQTLKVSAAYRDGYKVECLMAIMGPNAAKKARKAGEMMLQRIHQADFHLKESEIECLGNGDLVPGLLNPSEHLPECILRLSALADQKAALEYLACEWASLVTNGPAGTTGYLGGRPKVRPLYSFWPCLIPIEAVSPEVRL